MIAFLALAAAVAAKPLLDEIRLDRAGAVFVFAAKQCPLGVGAADSQAARLKWTPAEYALLSMMCMMYDGGRIAAYKDRDAQAAPSTNPQ